MGGEEAEGGGRFSNDMPVINDTYDDDRSEGLPVINDTSTVTT